MLCRCHGRINIILFIKKTIEESITPSKILRNFPLHQQSFHNAKVTDHFYTTCCRMVNARKAFDKIPGQKDSEFSWNAAIAWHARHAQGKEALKLFHDMQVQGLKPNQFVFSSVLTACSRLLAIEEGLSTVRAKCLTKCLCEMWSRGLLWLWSMSTMVMRRMH